MTTLLAFILAVGGLIVIHEYGHYRVAVACGVKVLRFSIGFGKPLLRWQRDSRGLRTGSVGSNPRLRDWPKPLPSRPAGLPRPSGSSTT
jgi:regulator of sigma E protease